MKTTNRWRLRRGGALLAAILLVTLTACGPLKAGSAASVGDTSLPQSTVEGLATEIDDTVSGAGAS
ncbi:MAG TPA: hypothetical protein VMT27_05170, partial [Actinomycetes bacterium]|nr:hypothetical protein [Actinomycetes bacterium]